MAAIAAPRREMLCRPRSGRTAAAPPRFALPFIVVAVRLARPSRRLQAAGGTPLPSRLVPKPGAGGGHFPAALRAVGGGAT